MANSTSQRLMSVRLDNEQIEKLKIIGESLYDDHEDGGSIAAMVRRAVDEFTQSKLAQPNFREKAEEALRRREEVIRRLLDE